MEKGRTIGIQKISALFDAGTFAEFGAYMKKDGEYTGVVCGYGSVGGKLVYAFAQDSDRKKGAFDKCAAEKLVALYAAAMKNGAPVVGVFDSMGASVGEGAGVMSAYGKVLKAVSDASGVIPQIALVDGVCAGLAATVAAMFDVVVTVQGSELFVNAPFLTGKEIGTAAYNEEKGLSSFVAESTEEAATFIRSLLAILPSNHTEGAYADETADDINRLVSVDGLTGDALASVLADAGSLVPLGTGYAEGLYTALTTFGGVTVGILATKGSLGSEEAKKAAKLIGFCDSFSIPVLTLVDCDGVAGGEKEEGTPLAAQLAKLAMAYASAETAKITVITGKAYGAVFTLLGSKSLGADTVYALPTATVSVMDPAAAVAFLWNDKITEEVTRASLIEEWKTECASPEAAASDGSIDDIINPSELRQRIISAVYMLMMKNEAKAPRRHCNLPL